MARVTVVVHPVDDIQATQRITNIWSIGHRGQTNSTEKTMKGRAPRERWMVYNAWSDRYALSLLPKFFTSSECELGVLWFAG